MADSNEVVMLRYCLSWRAGDFATVTDTWSDDVVVHISGRNDFSGTYRGKPDALDVSVRLQKFAPRYPIDIHDWVVGRDHAVVLSKERAVRGDQTLDADRLYVFHISDGKITEIWIFHPQQYAVDAFYTAKPG